MKRHMFWAAPVVLVVGFAVLPATMAAQDSGTPFGGSPWPFPGLVQAEDFNDGAAGVAYFDNDPANNGEAYRSTQVDIQATSDVGGGYSLGWVGAGEWLNYTVTVASPGTYSIAMRVASDGVGGTFHIEVDGVNKTGSVSVPNTGGWQNWKTLYRAVDLNGGTQVWRLVLDSNGPTAAVANFNWIGVSQAFGGTAVTLPGATVQAENFDEGGANVAYVDSEPANQGGQYRVTGVDIETASDAGGGYSIGYADAGEWLKYSVNVESTGTYRLDVRVASEGAGGTFHIEVNDLDVTGPLTVPDTGDWQTWTTVSKANVALTAGPQVWRLVMESNGATGAVGNLNWISATNTGGGSPELVVYTWNLQVDSYQPRAELQMHHISTLQPVPQVVVLQEAHKDIPMSVYIDKLTNDTGRQWTGIRYVDPSETGLEGTIIATSLTVLDSEWRPLGGCDNWAPHRYGIRAAVSFNGTTVQIFNTHLQAPSFESGPNSPNCPDNPDGERHPERQAAINDLREWAAEFPNVPRLVGGDFNAEPSWDEIADPSIGMTSAFNDAWVMSGNQTDGFTHKMLDETCNLNQVYHRIDYWFSDKQTASWTVLEASLPTGVGCFSGKPSDHLGVFVRYRLS